MLNNPFEIIMERLVSIEEQLARFNVPAPVPQPEIIGRDELCMRLNITTPTAIRWEKKGKIPALRVGSNVRYNWPKVIEALEKSGGNKL
jgi:excisionase family DNA binding protein